MIPQEIIEILTSRVSIVDIISRVTEVKKRGRNYFALCPFHNEKTPSFSINEEKGLYHCFGCGASGNSIKFLMDYYKMDFKEALYELSKIAGIDLSQYETARQQSYSKEKQLLLKIIAEATDFFHETLIKREKGEEAREYLAKRKIDSGMIKFFKLGYDGEDLELYQYLASRGYNNEELLKSGLFIHTSNGNIIERFRGRVIFPIFDKESNPVGFGGRIISDRKDLAKYINSPESLIFHKGELLFGLNFSKSYIEQQRRAYVVEGYMDVIALFQSGIRNVVAPLGTSLTESQLLILKRYSDEVIFLFDGDMAGINAANRAIDISTHLESKVGVVILPKGMDPYDFVMSNGKEATLKYLEERSLTPIDFKIKFLLKKFPIDKSKIDFLKNIFAYIKTIPGSITREEALKKVSSILNETFKVILTEYQNFLKKEPTFGRTIRDIELAREKTSNIEAEFIGYLITFWEKKDLLTGIVSEEMFENPEIKSLFEKIKNSSLEKVKNILFELQDENILNIITSVTLNENVMFETGLEKAYSLRLRYIKRKFNETNDISLKKELKTEALEIENIIRSFVSVY